MNETDNIQEIKEPLDQDKQLRKYYIKKGIIGSSVAFLVVLFSLFIKTPSSIMINKNMSFIRIILTFYVVFCITVILYYYLSKKIFDKSFQLKRIYDDITFIFLCIAILYFIFMYLISPTRVLQSSMLPTFDENDRVLIYSGFYSPDREDVVIISIDSEYYNLGSDDYYIKRIKGIPGDKIKYDSSTRNIYINDELVISNSFYWNLEENEFTLGKNEYFALGDNKNHSVDSRTIGIIRKKDIVGKAFFRFAPINKMKFFI